MPKEEKNKVLNICSFKYFNKKLLESGFRVLLFGNIISQFINFSFSLWISRLYLPEVYGKFNYLLSWISIIGPILLLRLEQSIMIRDYKDKQEHYYLSIMFLGILNSIVSFIFIFLVTDINLLNIIIIITSVIFTGINTQMYLISLKNQKYFICSISRILKTFFFNGLTISLGYIFLPTDKYISVSNLLSLVVEHIILLSVNQWIFKWKILITLKYYEIKNYIIENIDFIKWNLPNVILDLLNDWGYMLLLGKFFGDFVLGQYAMMYRIIKLPASLISSVIYQHGYSKAVNNNNMHAHIIKQNYLISIIIGLPVFSMLFLGGKFILSFIFGAQWKLAGEISEILAPAYFLHFIIVSSAFITIIKNKMKISFIITMADILLRISSIFIGKYFNNPQLSFYFLNVSLSLIYAVGLIFYWKISRV
ncbi:MAG: hypothetical protein OHK0036_08110 [Bacteroidia bacterium]